MATTSMLGGSLATQAQTSLMNAQQDRLMGQLQAQGAPRDNAKIEKAAKEFESMLLSNWLQQAEQSMATVPGADEDNEDSGGGGDQMMSLGVQSLAGALTASGGIGIASMIAKALQHAADKGSQEPPSAQDETAKTQKSR